MSYNLVFFKAKNYVLAKYNLIKNIQIVEVFFLTFLKIQKKRINHNYDINLSNLQIYLTNFKTDGINYYKNSWQIYFKLQLY